LIHLVAGNLRAIGVIPLERSAHASLKIETELGRLHNRLAHEDVVDRHPDKGDHETKDDKVVAAASHFFLVG
jgi:hypothetical protein